jgi:excisionase family DNA binding protein
VGRIRGAEIEAEEVEAPVATGLSGNDGVMQTGGEVVGGSLLTVKEAAERLKVSAATVYALCEAGKVAFTRVSTHAIRIAEADLVAFLLVGQQLQSPPTTRDRHSR